MAVKNDWIYFILTKLLAMVFVAGILWERYRCFFEKTVIRLVDISHIFLLFAAFCSVSLFGEQMKRESGESPGQSRCCEFR